MNMAERERLEKILKIYFQQIYQIYSTHDFREESFYPYLKILIEDFTKIFPIQGDANVIVLPKRTEAGILDFRIWKNGEIIGNIEAKTPDTNVGEIENSEQIKRYRNYCPNLILTDFLELRLYRNGNLISNVEVGRKFTLQSLEQPPVPEKLEEFYDLMQNFFSFSTPIIKRSSDLSIELARKTRFLENILQEELKRENDEVMRFYRAFCDELIETLTKERFADLYAQTITYGLFSARMRVKNGFKRETAWRFIPENLPLLKEIFHSMTGPHFPESIEWVVDDISQVLEKADISSIMGEFKLTRWEDDPVIHFYETFLANYDPKERKHLGVYYTPLPVVSYIVRSIHILLKEKFNKSEGLAQRDVTLLDPAAGTLTFVVQAIKQVKMELEENNKIGLLNSYIEEHILKHFFAFEILVAPYTIGHFKVSMVLEEMGYRFKEGERFGFYLTNTLEMREPKKAHEFLIDLHTEGEEARRIKKEVPILVILGNPPYSVSSENKSEFIENLMNDYKEDVRDERNIQPLSDDYIKFIRFGHWKIEQAGRGIFGFITNNSYLSGIIHRGMRRKLMETFDEVYILNLHGSSRIGERAQDGGKDENVFDIQQGVAIALFVKLEKDNKELANVFYYDLWGLRDDKYKYLFENNINKTKFNELEPLEPYYFFVPKDFSLQSEYESFWKVTDIFNKYSFGITTSRDHFVVGFTKEEIIQRLRIFNGLLPDEDIRQILKLKDTGTWNLSYTRKKVKNVDFENKIYPYAYRPFDVRFICYETNIIERDRFRLMKHILKENIALCTNRILTKPSFRHSFISNDIGDNTYVSNAASERTYFFPLYLYDDDEPKDDKSIKADFELSQNKVIEKRGGRPNITDEFMKAVETAIGRQPSPEEIFNYIYAVLYSPTYRKRYEEFLKIDFPRIPMPPNYDIFIEFSNLGRELALLHLLKHSILNKTEIGFPVSGSNKIEKVYYDDENHSVYINKIQYFEGISKDVWEYKIGAYQVLDSYLKYRKGRLLILDEIEHYMKVEKAIRLTIELQNKIDEIYCNYML
jgi:type I restriction-modification system DNA methylase subunit